MSTRGRVPTAPDRPFPVFQPSNTAPRDQRSPSSEADRNSAALRRGWARHRATVAASAHRRRNGAPAARIVGASTYHRTTARSSLVGNDIHLCTCQLRLRPVTHHWEKCSQLFRKRLYRFSPSRQRARATISESENREECADAKTRSPFANCSSDTSSTGPLSHPLASPA